jgi:hypothetical protein
MGETGELILLLLFDVVEADNEPGCITILDSEGYFTFSSVENIPELAIVVNVVADVDDNGSAEEEGVPPLNISLMRVVFLFDPFTNLTFLELVEFP